MNIIQGISQISGMLNPSAIQPAGSQTPTQSFHNTFLDAIDRVQDMRQDSSQKIQDLLNGGHVEIHQVAIATQKAELAFELAQQVRNKVVQAYQEVMKTQL